MKILPPSDMPSGLSPISDADRQLLLQAVRGILNSDRYHFILTNKERSIYIEGNYTSPYIHMYGIMWGETTEQLWKRDKILDPLICLPPGELLCKQFQQKLTELGVDWFPSIEASSADLVETYVKNGLGIGVSVAVPKKTVPENILVLPLPGFPPVIIGAMWRGRTTQLLQVFLNEFQARARKLM